jgi:nucleoid DNA-binding protein
MSVNKTRIALAIADQTGMSRNRSSKAMAAIIEAITVSLAAGEDVKIARFGKFYPQTLKARKGRHPKTGRPLTIQERKTVRLKCYKRLRDKINRLANGADVAPHPAPMRSDRRQEYRMDRLPGGKAVVRISGIPVCEFNIKDVSGNGTSILIEADSVVLRNLRVGQDIELHMVYADKRRKAVLQRSKVVHVTHQSENDAYPGHVIVGMKVIDTLTIQ